MPANRCPNPSCEYFNRALPNNAKVCPWCSTPLGNIIPATPSNPTNPQPVQPPIPEQPSSQPPPYVTQHQPHGYSPPAPPVYNTNHPRLPVFKLVHYTGRDFYLSGEGGSIGRRSQSMPIPPEIDLTGIPQEGVVSRRHARIFWDWSQSAYMIVDTSTNGVYLNGNLLNSGVTYRILNGDSLQLGQDGLVTFKVVVT